MDIPLQDLRYGIPVLAGRPAFTLIAILAGLSLLLVVIAAAAFLVAALRAARVDPVTALRCE